MTDRTPTHHRRSTTMNNLTTALAVHIESALVCAGKRLREERGQTAAEYMGVIVVIAAILAAVVGSGIGEKITGLIEDAVQKVFDEAGG
jgi:pilus assembly protein Flp/PilA